MGVGVGLAGVGRLRIASFHADNGLLSQPDPQETTKLVTGLEPNTGSGGVSRIKPVCKALNSAPVKSENTFNSSSTSEACALMLQMKRNMHL